MLATASSFFSRPTSRRDGGMLSDASAAMQSLMSMVDDCG